VLDLLIARNDLLHSSKKSTFWESRIAVTLASIEDIMPSDDWLGHSFKDKIRELDFIKQTDYSRKYSYSWRISLSE
jgi:hypothetical protein